MRKLFLLLAAGLMALQASAVPAVPGVQKFTQPDGTTVDVQIHGDEYYNYITTADGYTIIKNAAGYFTYAEKQEDGSLKASTMVARNAADRSAIETAALEARGTNLIDNIEAGEGRVLKAQNVNIQKVAARNFDYDKFKGLLILVQFKDKTFRRSDVNDFYDKQINSENYTGYTDEDGQSTVSRTFTGSVRDYFYDNSLGIFNPNFTIVGPVTVDYNCGDFGSGGTRYASTIFRAALNAANDLVDYSQFDLDGNGTCDMVYFLCAGTGSYSDPENTTRLWPHAGYSLASLRLDNVTFPRYACSVELLYTESTNLFDGIGTMCHEFSHVLGLPDLYDTNYETGGQSHDPGSWELMASGGHLNYGRTPAGYTAYDRLAAGFSVPTTLNSDGDYTLEPIGTTGKSYRLLTGTTNETFLIENRQKTKWDNSLPGHGLIIARMDSTSSGPWTANTVNASSSRNFYELLRAGNSTEDDVASDPFPGTTNVSVVSSTTTPALLTHDSNVADYALVAIKEDGTNVSFKVIKESDIKTLVEDYETMPVGETSSEQNVVGKLTSWNFTKSKVEAPGSDVAIDSLHAVGLIKASNVAMASPVNLNTYMVGFTAVNAALTQSKVTLSYQVDGSDTWTAIENATGTTSNTIAGGATVNLGFPVSITGPVKYRISMTAGSTTKKTYIDDFTIYYTGSSGVNDVYTDATNTALKVTRSGSNLVVVTADEAPVSLYNVNGVLLQTANVDNGTATLEAPAHGFYIVSQGARSAKVVY